MRSAEERWNRFYEMSGRLLGVFIVLVVVLLVVFIGFLVSERMAFDAMTEDEKIAYIDERTERHELVYIYPESIVKTNGLGGVAGTSPAWRFAYIDDDGNLVEKSGFYKKNDERIVVVGDKDEYSVYRSVETLTVSKDTLERVNQGMFSPIEMERE